MAENKSDYRNIFKNTFAFGFIQVFNVLIKVFLNKSAAIFLGSEGVGIIGVFQSLSQLLKTFFGFGIAQSVVRDISSASASDGEKKLSHIISLSKNLFILTSLIGAIFTLSFSSYLSELTFNDKSHSLSFVLLSFVVFLNIILDGNNAILKSLRLIPELAKSTVVGSLAGLFFCVPLYYTLGIKGIVPTLIAVSLFTVLSTRYYINRLNVNFVWFKLSSLIKESPVILKMGFSLMFATFLGICSEYIVKIHVLKQTSPDFMGIYQAGLTIVNGYFSVIIVAMMSDYYPRISAIFEDNEKLESEMNKQIMVGLTLISTFIITFIFLMPFVVRLLYSDDFLQSVEYMRYSIFWVLVIIVSNPIDMILVVKRNVKLFISITIFYRAVSVAITLSLFEMYELKGLGVSMLLMGFLHLIIMNGVVSKLYKIKLHHNTIVSFLFVLFLTVISIFISNLPLNSNVIIFSLLIFGANFLYVYKNLSNMTDLKIIRIIKSKIKF